MKSYTNHCPVIVGIPFVDETKATIKTVAKIIKGASDYQEKGIALVTFELDFNEDTEATFDELSKQTYDISTKNKLSLLYEAAFITNNDHEQLYHRLSADDRFFVQQVWKKVNVVKFEPNELNSTLVRTMLLMSGALPRYIVNSETDYLYFDDGDSFFYPFNHKKRDLFLPLKRHVPEFHWQYVLNKVAIMSNDIINDDYDEDDSMFTTTSTTTKQEAARISVQACVKKYVDNVYTIKEPPLLAEQSLIKKVNKYFECGSTETLRIAMSDNITAVVNRI